MADLRGRQPGQPVLRRAQIIQPCQPGHVLLQPAHRRPRRQPGQLRQRTLPAGRVHDQQFQQPCPAGGIQPAGHQAVEPAVDLGPQRPGHAIQGRIGRQLAPLRAQHLQRHVDHVGRVVLALQSLPHRGLRYRPHPPGIPHRAGVFANQLPAPADHPVRLPSQRADTFPRQLRGPGVDVLDHLRRHPLQPRKVTQPLITLQHHQQRQASARARRPSRTPRMSPAPSA